MSYMLEDLQVEANYDMAICYPGCKTVKLTSLADTDYCVAETIMKKD